MNLSREELVWLNNALNEVLHGPDAIHDSEFHARMGGTRDEVKSLFTRVHSEVERLG